MLALSCIPAGSGHVVGVDSLEKKKNEIEGRPYVLANPQLKDYPLIGEARGKDDPGENNCN